MIDTDVISRALAMGVIWMTVAIAQGKRRTARIILISESMTIYISGKIGELVISEATRKKFAKAQKELEAKGY